MKTTTTLSDPSKEEMKTQQTVAVPFKEKLPISISEKTTPEKTKHKKNELLVFIVDDDALYLKALEKSISDKLPHLKIKTFLTGEACLQQMRQKPEVVILDYFLDSKVSYAWNGLTILKQIKKLNPKTKVIMLSSQDSLEVAVKCIDNGSFDYISKSESAFVKINNVLTNIIEDVKLSEKGLKPYQIIGIVVIIILLLSYLILSK